MKSIRVLIGDLAGLVSPPVLPLGRAIDDEGGAWLVLEIAVGASLQVKPARSVCRMSNKPSSVEA